MRKNIFLIIILCVTIFNINLINVKAKDLPPCDISQYGSIKVVDGGSSTQDHGMLPDGTVYYNSDISSKVELDDSAESSKKGGWWKQGSATITFIVDAGYGKKINSIEYTFYHQPKNSFTKAVCTTQITPGYQVAKIIFTINKGHLKNINVKGFRGTVNSAEPISGSGGLTVKVNKGLSSGESMPVNTTKKNDTTTTKPSANICTRRDGSYCNQAEKDASSKQAEETGTAASHAGYVSGNPATDTYDPSKSDVKCSDVSSLVNKYWKYVMILVPIVLVLLITIDFVKAIVASDAEQLKKSASTAVKRTLATVILLILPVLLSVVLKWFGLELCL